MPDILTTEQAAVYLQVSTDAVKRLARQGKLPAAKVGRGWRFRKADLDEMFTEAMVDEALIEEAERVLSDPDTEWVPWEQVKAERGL
jgi:excisionase family DNA binding protein